MIKNWAKQLRKLLESTTDNMSDESIANVPAFVEKWKPDTNYEVGKRLSYNEIVYKVLQAHTSQIGWEPNAAVSLFAKVLIPDENVIPEWEQPDSTNSYMAGDKVSYDGKVWVSNIDNNAWAPGIYGWSEVEVE